MKLSAAKNNKAAKAPSPSEPLAGCTYQGGVEGSFQPGAYRSSHKSSSSAAQKPTPARNVVRGFSTHIPIVQTGTSQPRPAAPFDMIPEPSSSPQAKPVQPKKQQAQFALGGSSSCDNSLSDRGNSPDVPRQPSPQIKRKMFQVGGSSEEEKSLKSAMHSARSGMVTTRILPDPAIEHDQSESETAEGPNESAIIDDEEDDSDWEDSIEESGKPSIDEKKFFQRVDSKVNLTSRRSLITLILERNDLQVKLGYGASQSTPAIYQGRPQRQGPSFVSSPNYSDDSRLTMKTGTKTEQLKPIDEIPMSTAQPIPTPAHNTHHQAALSPRTEKRETFCKELPEINENANVNASSCDQYFWHRHRYHTEGW